MLITPDYKYLFLSDVEGYLKMFSLEKGYELVPRFFQKVHDGAIRTLACTHDSRYVFSADSFGKQKQFVINQKTNSLMLHRDWSSEFNHLNAIMTMAVTQNDQYLFTGDKEGVLRQFSILEVKLERRYKLMGKNGAINVQKLSSDDQWLFMGHRNGFLRQVSVNKNFVVKDYGWMDKGGIYSMYVTDDNRFLFVGASQGNLQQFCLKQRLLVRDYGRILDGNITRINGYAKLGFIWVVCDKGMMKCVNMIDQVVGKSFIVSSRAIFCLEVVNWNGGV